MFSRITVLFFFSFLSNICFSQETLPLYSDYLSDNVYLIHPTAAGIGNCGKLRISATKQWQGVANPPELQTISYHNRFGEKAAFGAIVFNDVNGYHSQRGIQVTYAFHLDLGYGSNFEQLSFGLSATAVQNQSDQRAFYGDPAIQQLIESTSYYNADFSVAYHKGGLSSYFTVKNLLLSAKNSLTASLEPLNLRNYIVSAGYYFGNREDLKFEPSFMMQFKEGTGEKIADVNFKVYKNLSKAQLWGALSYRRSFESNSTSNLQLLTPIVGVNYKNYMFSYTYTSQLGDIVFDNTGTHQLTLGINLFCRTQRAAGCPNTFTYF